MGCYVQRGILINTGVGAALAGTGGERVGGSSGRTDPAKDALPAQRYGRIAQGEGRAGQMVGPHP